ncbi:MAG: DUF4199 domain-containing protein [Sphingobium sp.]|jgi:hypothetical protein|uniref:DUF4199 domain-containing protein n=1 Tax=Sphingomonas ginsenosidimutans TaxID=862134 RepID=A0A2A4HUU8_9SPHN|nr:MULTISPECIES: DUF4199 domain-containing protein [Sphingomonadaceae]PCG07445.1 DUF4199 domain-containing protein [Sphingomonas ginsenosidimutans]SMC30351.1 Protein of unknown function [Novosphingobium sp. B1]
MPDLRTTLLAGLLSGGGAMAWTLFEFAMGWHNEHLDVGAKTGFVAVIFPVVAVGWALRRARQAGDGQLRWRSALAIGLGVSAISAAIGLAFFAAYYTIINPEFVAAMQARGAAVDVPSQLAAVVMGSLVVGMAITVIATLIMRKGGQSE